MKKITVRGLRFDSVTMSESVAFAALALEENRTISVFTPNAEIAQLAAENKNILDLLNRAELLLPDGAGIVLASEILQTPLAQKVAGVDFGSEIIGLAAQKGYPLFFLGGKPGVAALAAEKLQQQFPTLSIVGTHDGYFEKTGTENERILQMINESGASILFVCFGAPAQEIWIDSNKSRLPSVHLLAGLGGSLDIYAGIAKRAPSFFIRIRMEWLYRLIREPKRFKRMLKLPKYIVGACKEKLLGKIL